MEDAFKKQGKKNKITTILYDLEQDIGETKDVSKAHPEVVEAFTRLW